MTDSQTTGQTVRQTNVRGPTADRLRQAITRTSRRLRREAGGQLTPTQLATLGSISRHGVITPGDLAAIEGVQRPSITRVVSGLVDAGMIEKRPDPDDGRCFLLTVTAAGSTYLEQNRWRKSAWLARMLEELDGEDVRILEQAAAILETALAEDRV